ncbi:PspC domain-containing protein [Streptomyces griseoincarnatus]|uniref:Membrane protein n=1 Tax=Streptomyces variabilis TaxID=67372 RepID=A0ABQ2U2V2_9ACTN|nr:MULTISPECIES: PspC domain-containing protein [Streptomyces]MDH3037367.1 PspC domain-containing protein [Streptomyces sp. TRM75561]MQL65924.1 PspC domain-containing protein [Streptomyces vinaceus]GGP69437.1 membrane protein [Streptomyces griseoincarnatus]GGT66800.1 membrane protein [Streptomyces variabilis]
MTDHQHAAPGPGPRPGSGPGTPAAEPSRAGAGKEGTAGAPAGAVDPGRHFRRDRRHQMFGGVCSGLARQYDMDPVIFRITLAVLSATGGIGLIFYGFAWLFVPYDDEDENQVRRLLTGRVDGHTLAAVLFALVGCGVFLSMLSNDGVLSFAVILSLLLAGAAYWSRRRGTPSPDPIAAQAAADAPPEPQAPPVPAAYPSWWREPIVKDGTYVGGTGYLWGPEDSRDLDIATAVGVGVRSGSGGAKDVWRPPQARPPKPAGPRGIGGWVFLFALLAAGLGTGLTWETQPLGTSLQTGLACALGVIGLGIAVSAFLGRTGAGSIVLAVLTAGLLAGSTAMPDDIGTDWTRTGWRPASVAQIRPVYDLGAGEGKLDLSAVRVPAGDTVSTQVEVGLGRIHVIVPRDATVRLHVEVGLGDIQVPGDGRKDVDVAPGKYKEMTLEPPPGAGKAGTLRLDLRVGAGQAEVSRAAS